MCRWPRWADAGRGRHYYGQTADDLEAGFAEEFALLEALYARGIALTFVAGAGLLIERDHAVFMKESLYSHDRMSRRLVAHGEASYAGSIAEDAKPEFLRRRPTGMR
jgi:hypothetical protein